MSDETLQVDTLVVGSGPVGAAFARRLVEAGQRVCMVDTGPQLSRRPGEHLKNAALYQRNLDLFSSVIRGHLTLLSVPSRDQTVVTLDPSAYRVDLDQYEGFVSNNQNPEQDPGRNLGAAAACYAVGGMATHWTCATPRHHPAVERSDLLTASEWNTLYREAEQLFKTNTETFGESVRHQIVLQTLRDEYSELLEPYDVQSLPLAVERRRDNPAFVRWSGTDTILGPLADGRQEPGEFDLRPDHLCMRLFRTPDGERIERAELRNLRDWRIVHVEANDFVVACGAVLTPQLLYASHIRPEPLGRYMTEQPVAFCQIVLQQGVVECVETDRRFADKVQAHRQKYQNDPLPIPSDDPEPNVWIPVSEHRPWHCQIHRDAFHYGEVAPNVDTRLIVDLRWFGIVKPRIENCVTFSDTQTEAFGMPQPSFTFDLDPEDRANQHAMMKDMLRAASVLGGFLPGSEPQFVEPGLPLHIGGTTRMGDNAETSVVDKDSRVWGIDNLYLGGNGLIPRGTASNPTLTSVAMALKAARHLLDKHERAATREPVRP
jgi:pyranose oxidase